MGADFSIAAVLRREAVDAAFLFGVASLAAGAVTVLAATLEAAIVQADFSIAASFVCTTLCRNTVASIAVAADITVVVVTATTT